MAKKVKYTEEIVETICREVALNGRDSSGYLAVDISRATFYRWMKDRPDFYDRVARARRTFSLTSPPVLKLQAKKALAEYLFKGHIVEREVITDDGEIVALKTNQGVPAWAIKAVLPPQNLEDAIELVQRSGYLVIDPLEMKEQGEKRGLGAETMATIRSEILGIEGVKITPEAARQIDITPIEIKDVKVESESDSKD